MTGSRLVSIAALCVAVAACGGGGSSADKGEGTPDASPSPPAVAPDLTAQPPTSPGNPLPAPGTATEAEGCSLALAPNTWTDWIELGAPGVARFPDGLAGRYEFRGWNGISSDAQRSYLYEGYRDDHVGGYRGYSIYANAVYAIDLEARRMRLAGLGNWRKGAVTNPVTALSCHITYPSIDTWSTNTPADRHPYGGFHVSDDGREAMLMFGANAYLQFSDRPEDMCRASSSPADAWSLDLATGRWSVLRPDPRCTWCSTSAGGPMPEPGATGGTKVASFPGDDGFYAVVTHGSNGSTYVMRYDRGTRQWEMLSERALSPGGLSTIAIAADTRRRRLLVEVVVPQSGHAAGFYTFDVASRQWQPLARAAQEPRSSFSTDRWVALAYDEKRDLYFFNSADGLYSYDPSALVWNRVSAHAFPYRSNLVGLTYDRGCDVLLGRSSVADRHQWISVYAHRP